MREMIFKNMMSKDKRFNETLMADIFEHRGISRAFERRIIVKIIDILELRDNEHAKDLLYGELHQHHHPETYIVHRVDRSRGLEEQLCKVVGYQYIIAGTQLFIVKLSCCSRRVVRKASAA